LRLLCFSSVPPDKCRDCTLKLSHGRFFHVISNSSLTYHTFIWRYKI